MYKNDTNPIMRLDYPDPDVIRVEDTYYMVTTTMHFMPGCEILRSYDLVNWEHVTYVYDTLDHTPEQRLLGKENCYGKGMWAASLRYHKGTFYILFVANDTQKTYLYTADVISGPWKKSIMEGFYHDGSLLFEEDRVYVVYGNTDIHLLELKSDLSGPLEGGLNRIIVTDHGNPMLGYEGSHFYKIDGRYYLFLIHSLPDQWRRVEACFMSDSLEGEFLGCDILNDDLGYCNQGVAQGGIVDSIEGEWYGILFQDRGAVGRIPVLVPMVFEDKVPVFGKNGVVPKNIVTTSTRPSYRYRPLVQSDDFKGNNDLGSSKEKNREEYGCFGLKSVWQFNHEPELSLIKHDKTAGNVRIWTKEIKKNVVQARNMLTQRMIFPACSAEIEINAEGLKEGDYAGLCGLQSCYGMVALTKRKNQIYVVMQQKEIADSSLQALPLDDEEGTEVEAIPIKNDKMRLKMQVDFWNGKDEATFFYWEENEWKKIGKTHNLYFKIDHFTGCRFGLFIYSTLESGGYAEFSDFIFNYPR